MKKVKISLFVKSDKTNEKGHIAVYYKIQSGFSKTTFSAGVSVAAKRWKITDQYRITSVLTEKKIRNTFDCGIADLEELGFEQKLQTLTRENERNLLKIKVLEQGKSNDYDLIMRLFNRTKKYGKRIDELEQQIGLKNN